jgi:hypothetical protein
MSGVTEWVRRALSDLGPKAPDQAVKAYIRERDPTGPPGHVSLALRELRGKVRPSTKKAGAGWWSAAEGPPTVAVGAVLFWLAGRARAKGGRI